MTCACKQPSLDQEQYALDLLNRRDRYDSTTPVCKVGKLCNGKCIPKNHQCGGKAGSLSSSVDDHNDQMMYEYLGGDDYVNDLVKLHKKMTPQHAKNYMREVGQKILNGDNTFEDVNAKYKQYFSGR